MTDAQITLLAKWINESISADQIDRLTDHIEGARLDSDEANELAEQFLDALNDE